MAKGDAQQKAAQRARNGGSTRSGTSGTQALAAHMERREFADIEDQVDHIGDLQCLYQSGILMANRSLSATIVVQKEWAHELMDIALQSQGLALYCRFYTVPLSAVLPDDEADDDE